ncbi:MAG: hypothetical protein ACYSSI_09335, partial [Planctomycetota bacterium]
GEAANNGDYWEFLSLLKEGRTAFGGDMDKADAWAKSWMEIWFMRNQPMGDAPNGALWEFIRDFIYFPLAEKVPGLPSSDDIDWMLKKILYDYLDLDNILGLEEWEENPMSPIEKRLWLEEMQRDTDGDGVPDRADEDMYDPDAGHGGDDSSEEGDMRGGGDADNDGIPDGSDPDSGNAGNAGEGGKMRCK